MPRHAVPRLAPVCLVLVAALAAAGCSRGGGPDAIRFDGQVFRAFAQPEDRRNRQDFTVTVRGVSRSVEGAREAGRFEGTRHCITYYGTSDIDWTVGPDTEAAALPVVDDTLTLSGSCRDGGA